MGGSGWTWDRGSIRLAVRLRRNNGEADEWLEDAQVRTRLRFKHKHSIGALIHELNRHLEALSQPSLPKDTMRLLTALAMADPKGEAFRYASDLSDRQDYMDFPTFNAAVKEAYSITSATYDMLDAYARAQEDWMEDMSQMRAEYEVEMRAEYETTRDYM